MQTIASVCSNGATVELMHGRFGYTVRVNGHAYLGTTDKDKAVAEYQRLYRRYWKR